MNQNPIVLYIDADYNDSFLSYTQDPDKISKNINHFGEEYAQDIEIRKSIYTDDVVSINIVGKYICILHTNTEFQRMLLLILWLFRMLIWWRLFYPNYSTARYLRISYTNLNT